MVNISHVISRITLRQVCCEVGRRLLPNKAISNNSLRILECLTAGDFFEFEMDYYNSDALDKIFDWIKTTMKHVLPVYSVPFMSKHFENAVEMRKDGNLEHYNSHDNYESAYRRSHKIESALLKMQSGIAATIDEALKASFIILDLSTVFDVIDYLILLKCLDCVCINTM